MKLKLKTKIAYGLPGVGDSALYNLAETFLLFFLSTVAGLDPGIAGLILAAGAVWETLCGAAVGYISDQARTPFGRRKPFLMAAAFPLAVFTSLLFTVIDAGQGVRILYYGFMLLMFWTFFSVFFVPYLAWGAELTQDYDERTVLRGCTYLFNNVGMAIGMILPTVIVDVLVRQGESRYDSWQMMAVFCGLCSALTIFCGAAGIRDRYEQEYREKKGAGRPEKRKRGRVRAKKVAAAALDMAGNYGQLLKLRTVRFILAASVFYLIAYAVFCADRMYFFTYNMKLSAGEITFVMTMMTFSATALVPVILAASRRFDKRTLYIAGMSLCAASMTAFGLAGISSIVSVTVFSAAYCVGSICYWQLIPAMLYDVCEVDQLVNGRERAGLVISLQSLSESLANAAGLQLLGLVLKFSGFDGTAPGQEQRTLFWTNMAFTLIPAFFMALSIAMIVKYPVTKKMYNKVLQALKRRAEGEETDMTEFEKLK